MTPKWIKHLTFAPGMFAAHIDLASGCKIELHNFYDTKEQKAELTLQLKGVNYNKVFRRPLPEDDSIENAEDWIFPEIKKHFETFDSLKNAAISGICEKEKARIADSSMI